MIAIPVDPVAKPRMTRADKWQQRPVVERYWTYCDCLRLSGAKLSGRMQITFHLPMPGTWSRKKRDRLLGEPHTQRPDIDNLIKGVLDALSEQEDSHVFFVVAGKFWSNHGRVEILNLED